MLVNPLRLISVGFASRSTVLGGSAVFEVANALLAKIRAAAGARLGCAAEQIELADGCARAADGRSLAFAQLAAGGLRVTTATALRKSHRADRDAAVNGQHRRAP